MSSLGFSPPYISHLQVGEALRARGDAVLNAASVQAWLGVSQQALQTLARDWDDLPPDEYLKDGGRYRRRRHASFELQAGVYQPVAHRAHWQPLEYNALHGGMERWFDPVQPHTVDSGVWQRVMQGLGTAADALIDAQTPQHWFGEAHQFRIDTAQGIGRPTPEGAHRDGVELVVVFLVQRAGVRGGETRVFEATSPKGERFTLTEPWSVLLLDDARMIHETTPIQPAGHAPGVRDTLVVTLRRGGFQDPVPVRVAGVPR